MCPLVFGAKDTNTLCVATAWACLQLPTTRDDLSSVWSLGLQRSDDAHQLCSPRCCGAVPGLPGAVCFHSVLQVTSLQHLSLKLFVFVLGCFQSGSASSSALEALAF